MLESVGTICYVPDIKGYLFVNLITRKLRFLEETMKDPEGTILKMVEQEEKIYFVPLYIYQDLFNAAENM